MTATRNVAELLEILLLNHSDFIPESASALTGLIMQGYASDVQISAFLVALKLTRLDVDPKYISAIAAAMRISCVKITHGFTDLVDIVGTGGDGHDTFNVSTAASIIAAGAGCRVAKHGNRASSSKCGSADVLQHLGCDLSMVGPDIVPRLLHDKYAFLFAQIYHPAMRYMAKARKELGVRTIFNFLGPLINPTAPKRMVVGVYSQDVGLIMAESLLLSGIERAMVVCGNQGLDELSPIGESYTWTFDTSISNAISCSTLHPTRDFGLQEHPLSAVVGGDGAHNAGIMRELLGNRLPISNAILDFVLMNAAAVIYLAGVADSLMEGVRLARESITSGRAAAILDRFVQSTTRLL